MTVLVTGGFGLVGRSAVRNLLLAGHHVRLFDRRGSAGRLLRGVSSPIRRILRRLISRVDVREGDICNIADVGRAVRGVDAVLHLAAMIPPVSDRNPEYADFVNRGGTGVLVRACEERAPHARFVYSSSVSVYGDRLANPQIMLSDETAPGANDTYAQQKLAAEAIVSGSTLSWTICRLSAIASPEKLALDPILFDMPLDTSIEWCTAEDAGRALARTVDHPELAGRIYHLAGGPRCRTTYREYVDRLTGLMGLGTSFLPEEAFSAGSFHCGFMEAEPLEIALRFQTQSLEDYYRQVNGRVALRRPFARLLRSVIRAYLCSQSKYWKEYCARNPLKARHQVRFGWIFAGRQAGQLT